MTFSHRLLAGVFGGFLLLAAGCDLHDFIHWAPDGQHAFVQGADGTWLVDSSGAILGPATDARAWLPDSQHVIAVHAVKAKTWDEYAQLLGTGDVDFDTAGSDDFEFRFYAVRHPEELVRLVAQVEAEVRDRDAGGTGHAASSTP